ncbi:hypothetical protein [Hymenobacter volaticus]|uniref:Uncharacterized protein n=1 Tax=Hymenobacter volaticus TaxID=2932254 RepID=A0ABY4G1B5_9BACT|nr:hypothetical protein [Hymenobacter volaticus]UOQ64626.1 hypothetical protein MUN86_13670 [Hymenobacter volaticus]
MSTASQAVKLPDMVADTLCLSVGIGTAPRTEAVMNGTYHERPFPPAAELGLERNVN